MGFSLHPRLAKMAPLGIAFAVLFGVGFLPPDTALEELQAQERLSVCAPRDMAPLVTRDRDRPGFEIALLTEAAARLGWRLNVMQSAGMGREYNPHNWRLTRATCRVLVGGLRDNSWMRTLFEVGKPYLRTHWAVVSTDGQWPVDEALFAPGVVALDRVALKQALQAAGVTMTAGQDVAGLKKALEAGSAAAVVTDVMVARAAFAESGYAVAALPDGPEPAGIGAAFWKGDTTLLKQFDQMFDAMRADGTVARIAADYGVSDFVVR